MTCLPLNVLSPHPPSTIDTLPDVSSSLMPSSGLITISDLEADEGEDMPYPEPKRQRTSSYADVD